MDLRFLCPLPTNRGGLKLYIDGWRIGLIDADVDDYINQVFLYGIDFNSAAALDTNEGNYTAPAEIIDAFATKDLSSYACAVVRVVCFNTDAAQLDITEVAVHAYYDT